MSPPPDTHLHKRVRSSTLALTTDLAGLGFHLYKMQTHFRALTLVSYMLHTHVVLQKWRLISLTEPDPHLEETFAHFLQYAVAQRRSMRVLAHSRSTMIFAFHEVPTFSHVFTVTAK